MSDKPTVGFIGLGIMGRPMSQNVLKGGYPLVVYDLVPALVDTLVAAGARAATSPRAVAEQAEVVLLCLPDSPQVRAALYEPEGVFAGTRAGQVIIDMSTISPVATREFAAEATRLGASMLDAPVSGGEIGASQGTLSIMVGGDAATLEQARPVLETMGKTILHIGAAGAGQVAKACNQIVIAVTIEAVAEAMVLAAKAGVDPALVRQALMGGAANSRVLDYHGDRFLKRNFTPGFRTRLQYKDLNIALDAGREYGAPLPATALVQQMYGALMAQGLSEEDHTRLLTVLETLAGQEAT